MRKIIALPTRCGGLGVVNPQEECTREYAASCLLSGPLTKLILQQEGCMPPSICAEQKRAKTAISQQKTVHITEATEKVLGEVQAEQRRMIELASEKGVSSWLTTLPIEDHSFHLSKTAFWDAIHLRYGWRPERLPDKCVCGVQFSVEHALTCPVVASPSPTTTRSEK